MPTEPLTRRSLLLAAGGALAGGLARPERALAALAPDAPAVLAERRLGDVRAGERTIELARSADLAGVEWQAPASARLQLRFLAADGRWSAWVAAGGGAHGPDHPVPGALIGEPVWTGGTRSLQLRASHALRGVRLRLVDVSGGLGAHRVALAAQRSPLASLATSSPALAQPTLQAGPGQPAIIARSVWARGMAPPRVAPGYGAVRLAFVHHTENPNGYAAGEVPAMLRAIYAFHYYVRGWNDIGYNFVIDAFGRIFEARAGGIDEPVVGAQAGGYNLVSTGVAVLGSFSSQPINAASRRALAHLLAWKLALHGVPGEGRVTVRVNPAGAVYSRYPAGAHVPLPRIAGHRDADATECPGDALYSQLRGIRGSVLRLAPRPVVATIALSAAPLTATAPSAPSPPAPSAPAPASSAPASSGEAPPAQQPPSQGLAGTLAFLDGTAIAGASIQIQSRVLARRGELVAEQTLAQVQSDAAGAWSLPGSVVSAPQDVSLRALYAGAAAGAGGPAGAGAAVSVPLPLASATISPAAAPAPTPAAAPAPGT